MIASNKNIARTAFVKSLNDTDEELDRSNSRLLERKGMKAKRK
jgi:hypothetical protein